MAIEERVQRGISLVHERDIADEQKLSYREHENATRATKNTPWK